MRYIRIFAAVAAVSFSWLNATAQTYIERVDSADRYLRREMWADAERSLLGALRLEPGNPGNSLLLSNLGYARLMQGRIDDALESFDVALAMTPRSTTVLSNRAMAYIAASRPADAIADLSAALEVDSMLQRPLRLRGFLLLGEGDIAGAKADLTRVSQIDGNDDGALAGLAQIAVAEGDAEKAVDYYSRAIALSPDEEYYLGRGLLNASQGRLAEAADDVRAGLSHSPRSGNLFLLRAYINKLAYRNEDSAADKKIALANGADPQLFQRLFPGDSDKR